MKKRTKILGSTLAITFLLMLVFIFTQHNGNKEQIIPALIFGVILVVSAIFSLKVEKRYFSEKSIIKIVISSLAIAFGLIILTAIIALPFVGFKSLDAVNQYMGIAWPTFALVVSPLAAKYVK